MSVANFAIWWNDFCQLPDHDGVADDSAPDEKFVTRWGWTYETWTTARRWMRFKDTSWNTFGAMTQAEAGTLAHGFFWQRQGGDLIPPGLDIVTLDWVWTSGGAPFEIQQQLGFTGFDVDGSIGPHTAAKIAGLGVAYIDAMTGWRTSYYDELDFRDIYPGLYSRAADCAVLAKSIAIKPTA